MDLHLDLIGGLAGDMFIAALLDAFPQHETAVVEGIAAAADRRQPTTCAVHAHSDGVLKGRRFEVIGPCASIASVPFATSPTGVDAHRHTSWQGVRAQLLNSGLVDEVKDIALGIFELLAKAEATVHGVPCEEVSFHEVGAWDSIADIVGASVLIHAVGVTGCTASPAPLGHGRIETQHGMLPVPAPATVQLLMGMATMDDGIAGERITPTGAAILRYLVSPGAAAQPGPPRVRTLAATGTGFGSRVLPGLSNHVRVLCFVPSQSPAPAVDHRQMHVLEFEVDDQSGEDLANGLDRLRSLEGVLDVIQSPVYGKKGRLMMHVRVLARDSSLQTVVNACFRETTTIGLRHRVVQAIGLKRRFREVCIDGHPLRVKVVERPGGITAKTESDDVTAHQGHALRVTLRARAEAQVLEDERPVHA